MATRRTCPACDSEVIPGDEYCASCGASLSGFWMNTWTSPPPEDPAAIGTSDDDDIIPLPLPQPTHRRSRRSHLRVALIASAVILLGALVATAFVLAQQDDDDPEPQVSGTAPTLLDAPVSDAAGLAGGAVRSITDSIVEARDHSLLPSPATPASTAGTADAGSRTSAATAGFAGGSFDEGVIEFILTTIDPSSTETARESGSSP